MARFNEFGGRTNKAWQHRYSCKEAAVSERVAELQKRGHDAVAVEITAHGATVPGGIKYYGGIEIGGKRVSRRQVRELLDES